MVTKFPGPLDRFDCTVWGNGCSLTSDLARCHPVLPLAFHFALLGIDGFGLNVAKQIFSPDFVNEHTQLFPLMGVKLLVAMWKLNFPTIA